MESDLKDSCSLTENMMRKIQQDKLSDFISTSYNRVNNILEEIGWDIHSLETKGEEMVHCPMNPEHTMPKESLEKHIPFCSLKHEGYSEFDIPLPDTCGPYGGIPETSIIVDKDLQARIIQEAAVTPVHSLGSSLGSELDNRMVSRTSDRIFSDFTADERLAMYNYVIRNTKAPSTVKVEELNLLDIKKEEKPRPKTKLEMLIEERNAKRRRVSYRNKVHTNRKSQTEILREVIQGQMEVLEEMLNPENAGKDGKNSEERLNYPSNKKEDSELCTPEYGKKADRREERKRKASREREKSLGKSDHHQEEWIPHWGHHRDHGLNRSNKHTSREREHRHLSGRKHHGDRVSSHHRKSKDDWDICRGKRDAKHNEECNKRTKEKLEYGEGRRTTEYYRTKRLRRRTPSTDNHNSHRESAAHRKSSTDRHSNRYDTCHSTHSYSSTSSEERK